MVKEPIIRPQGANRTVTLSVSLLKEAGEATVLESLKPGTHLVWVPGAEGKIEPKVAQVQVARPGTKCLDAAMAHAKRQIQVKIYDLKQERLLRETAEEVIYLLTPAQEMILNVPGQEARVEALLKQRRITQIERALETLENLTRQRGQRRKRMGKGLAAYRAMRQRQPEAKLVINIASQLRELRAERVRIRNAVAALMHAQYLTPAQGLQVLLGQSVESVLEAATAKTDTPKAQSETEVQAEVAPKAAEETGNKARQSRSSKGKSAKGTKTPKESARA